MKDDWVIVVPSYNRVKEVQEKTLATLKHYKIDRSRIYVIVANEEQKSLYAQGIPKELYGHLIVGVPGLREVRNFIYEYFPFGKHFVSFDDDVSGILKLSGSKLVPLPSLKDLIKKGFAECIKRNYHLWGVAPIANAFFMKDTISTDPKFLIGHMWGFISDKKFKHHLVWKDDYERCLFYSKQDGGVIRFNDIACKTKLGAKGGLNTPNEKRLQENKKSIQYLMSKYPEYLRLNPRRPGEILMKLRKLEPAAKGRRQTRKIKKNKEPIV